MTPASTGDARATEVWNRATSGEPASDRQGDEALAHALRFLGYAEGDGLLSAVEHEREEQCVGTGASAFLWFGLKDATRLVEDVTERWYDLMDDDQRDPDARAAALGELEAEADRRFALLDLGDRLHAALRTALQHRAEHFAGSGGTTGALPAATSVSGPERPGWAVRIPPEEKLRRTVQAYEAFGLRAEAHDGQLLIWPPDDAGWEVLDEVTRLLDHRYPTDEER